MCKTTLIFGLQQKVLHYKLPSWRIELIERIWNSLLPTMKNDITIDSIMHDETMLYRASCISFLAIQHLPNLAGGITLGPSPNLTSKICDKLTKLIDFKNWSIYIT